ncbi:cytochrome P450 [Paraphoma chrysanthemicola]|uniref:Cytochrome P450 n=1 Tax=Paraphoma chrysanthemicola TaxID=798071 RepID=A0A8K0RBV3_9PLEO|nr:cytochrome P450 [Paraphoma chrysanthemicola]
MSDLHSASWIAYCLVIFGLTLVYLLIGSLVQYGRLRHVPGPPLAAWTDLWLVRQMHRKETLHTIKRQLHRRYGPIQRYGPNRVMFSDPAAIPVILGSTNVFQKGPSNRPTKSFANGLEVATFVGMEDEARVSRLKRNLHSTFSVNGVLAYEQHVDETVAELVQHLSAAGPIVNLSDWTTWFAFDTMARLAFSEDQGFMRKQEDIDGAAEAARMRFAHWNRYWAMPRVEAVLFKNWFARHSKRPPSGLTRLAMRAIESRRLKGGIGAHADILDLFLRCGESDPELFTAPTIIGLTITTIQAGSETTGYTTAICIYHLLTHPRVLAALRKELETVSPTTPTGWDSPPAAALRSLPYLEACVKESNRLRPTVHIPSERIVPAGGRTIAGVFIPGGTIVANNASGMYMDANLWGLDVNAYRPERWLEGSEEQCARMNRANLLFSAGKRMCLGINVSWLEMRKVIPALVMNFEMTLVHPEKELYQHPGIFGEPGELLVRLERRYAN